MNKIISILGSIIGSILAVMFIIASFYLSYIFIILFIGMCVGGIIYIYISNTLAKPKEFDINNYDDLMRDYYSRRK